jgi:hypothetical protein
MSWRFLAIVTVATPGTPVQVQASHLAAQAALFQALPNNTARVVIGSDNTVRANASNVNPSGTVLAILGAPATTVATPPSATGGNPTSPGAVDMQNFWVDATNTGEGVIVSYLV